MKPADQPTALWSALAILAISLILQAEFDIKHALLFLIGTGLGISLMHAVFGFTGGWRRFQRERRSAGIRAQLLLLALSSVLFFPVIGHAFPGVHAVAANGSVALMVLVGAFLFGIGMQLGGGCGSGTLFTVGGGHVVMLIVLAFFVVGATVATLHLPWWNAILNGGRISIIDEFGGWLPALVIQLAAFTLLYYVVTRIERQRHGSIVPLIEKDKSNRSFSERLVSGPWPMWWGAIGLSVFGLATLLTAGFPWSVTFAFGLWGAKIWAALGGDPASWGYWSGGYPAKALSSSVLADTVSIMNFGIILGAVLASALAGKFAPPGKIPRNRLAAAIIGGLLLGYGARLAFGCNIGALLGGIASGSLHGWVWLVAGFTGSAVGVRIRVLMKLDPPPRGS
ncbi:MAG: YeeE/YedE family protein [Acidiferrobacterales bacterium]